MIIQDTNSWGLSGLLSASRGLDLGVDTMLSSAVTQAKKSPSQKKKDVHLILEIVATAKLRQLTEQSQENTNFGPNLLKF